DRMSRPAISQIRCQVRCLRPCICLASCAMTNTEFEEPTEAPRGSRNPIRRLYDWMLSWAERPGGPIALGGLSFAESSFSPIPPDPLLLALALGKPRKTLVFAAICTLGS